MAAAEMRGMGARYWYATTCKLAESVLRRAADGENVRSEAAALLPLMEGGPWSGTPADMSPLQPPAGSAHERAEDRARYKWWRYKPANFVALAPGDDPPGPLTALAAQLAASLVATRPEFGGSRLCWSVGAWARAETIAAFLFARLDRSSTGAEAKEQRLAERLANERRREMGLTAADAEGLRADAWAAQ